MLNDSYSFISESIKPDIFGLGKNIASVSFQPEFVKGISNINFNQFDYVKGKLFSYFEYFSCQYLKTVSVYLKMFVII